MKRLLLSIQDSTFAGIETHRSASGLATRTAAIIDLINRGLAKKTIVRTAQPGTRRAPLTCVQCGSSWAPKTENPRQCVHCRRTDWKGFTCNQCQASFTERADYIAHMIAPTCDAAQE